MEVPKLNLSSLKERVSKALKKNDEKVKKGKVKGKGERREVEKGDGRSDRRKEGKPAKREHERENHEVKQKFSKSEQPKRKSLDRVKQPKERKSGKVEQAKQKKVVKREQPEQPRQTKELSDSKSSLHEHSRLADSSTLRQDALAMGASEEDLKLIEGVEDGEESEQEFEGGEVDGKLQEEVEEYMKGLGLGNGEGAEDGDELEEEEEAADGEDDQEEESVDESVDESAEESADESAEESAEQSTDESSNHFSEAEEASNLASVIDRKAKFQELPESDSISSPTTSSLNPPASLQTVNSSKFIVPPQNDWYKIPLDLKSSTVDRSLKQYEIDDLYNRAQKIINKENDLYYEELNKSSSQRRFLSQILTNGTLSDKVSALTLLVQEAPLHNIKALDNLLGMCSKKSRTAALQCVDAVTDLFVNGIIPSDRKLKYFKSQPLTRDLSDSQLAIFYFEDYLKKWYFDFVSLLEKLSHDSIVFVRTKVVGHLFALLMAKPEQEANLLRLGVNKLGDIDNRVSSKTSYSILTLQQKHPAMKEIIVDSVVDVMFREKNEQHAIYYSIVTLNQTILTSKEESLANRLVNAYFALFEKLLVATDSENVGKMKESEHTKEGRHKRGFKRGKKGGKSVKADQKSQQEVAEEKNSKTFAAILTGLNRAFPFSNLPDDVFESHLETLYRITHSSNFNTSVQALLLVQKVVSKKPEAAKVDRYYRTLYESLLDDRLLTSSKQAIYLNLLFKSLKQDDDKERVMAFVKRICQVCLNWINIGTISGMLYLLVELGRSKEGREVMRSLGEGKPVEVSKERGAEDSEATSSQHIYDPRKRDPKFAAADKTSLWELEYFTRHYHPTVDLYAAALFDNTKVGKPDLGLFSLSHFLDRFVYKKARKNAPTHGHSIMQPLGGPQTGDLLVRSSTGKEIQEIPANTEEWIIKKAESVRPEDRFFYQYFSSRQDKLQRSKYDKEIEAKGKEAFEDEEELDEDAVWEALVASNPEAEADGDDLLDNEVSDLSMSDFEDEESEADEEIVGEGDDSEEDEEEENANEDADEDDGLVHVVTDDDDDEEVEAKPDSASPDSSDSDIDDLLAAEKEDEIDEESNKRPAEEEGKRKRVKLSSLPLYASVEDYADLLD